MKTIQEYLDGKKISAVLPITEAYGENKIYFPDAASFAIYCCELLGQVSDGYWENARPSNHWHWISETEPVIEKDKVGYTGPRHKVRYSVEWLKKYVKKALDGTDRQLGWADRVFMYGKMGRVTPDNLIKDIARKYDAWRSICQELPDEPVDNEGLKKIYLKDGETSYRNKYWDAAGEKFFNDELLKKFYDSKYDWKDFVDDLETAGKAMNTQI